MTETRHSALIFNNETVAAGTGRTLSSKRISRPYRLQKISVSFPAGSQRLNRIYIINSEDAGEPTTKPQGANVFMMQGGFSRTAEPFLVGDDETIEICHVVDLPEDTYLKIWANNLDATYAHTIDVRVEILLLED